MDAQAFYNEIDPFAAQWLRELVREGLIAPGEVDERSIKDLAATDLRGFGRCHFFAGIGGWDYALKLAGWPADRPVWTGSCPCQPYSSAGKGEGDKDPRNLWPDFFRLIRECRPQCVFGEQVEGAIKHGWLDRVCADLEGEGYTVGACVLGAHSAGAPHIRQRLYWVAHTRCEFRERRSNEQRSDGEGAAERGEGVVDNQRRGAVGGLADAEHRRQEKQKQGAEPRGDGGDGSRGVEHPTSHGREQRRPKASGRGAVGGCGVGVALGDTDSEPGERVPGSVSCSEAEGGSERVADGRIADGLADAGDFALGAFWSNARLINCRDGKARRIPAEPALFPLAHGFFGRVGVLRGAGNAIVPQVAAEFVKAFLEVETQGRVRTAA